MEKQRVEGMETHNCKGCRERCSAVTSCMGTYRVCVIECVDAYPGDVHHGEVPILQRH